MVLTNGFAKSGCHALVKAVQLLGQPCEVNHLDWGAEVPPHTHHVYIKRDPRNVAISWLRYLGQTVAAGTFLTTYRRFGDRSLVEMLTDYEPWLTFPGVHVVAYEDLIANDRALRDVADYLGIPYLDRAWTYLPGLTPTWKPLPHSDYRTIWTEQVEEQWQAEGGPELLGRWGY